MLTTYCTISYSRATHNEPGETLPRLHYPQSPCILLSAHTATRECDLHQVFLFKTQVEKQPVCHFKSEWNLTLTQRWRDKTRLHMQHPSLSIKRVLLSSANPLRNQACHSQISSVYNELTCDWADVHTSSAPQQILVAREEGTPDRLTQQLNKDPRSEMTTSKLQSEAKNTKTHSDLFFFVLKVNHSKFIKKKHETTTYIFLKKCSCIQPWIPAKLLGGFVITMGKLWMNKNQWIKSTDYILS